METLVSLLALGPLLVLTPYIGKYLDVKAKVAEASRYAAFQRTIFSDPGASWGAEENSRSDGEIANDVERRFFGDPRSAILSGSPTVTADNPLWRDHDGQTLRLATASTTLGESASPEAYGPAVDLFSSGTNVLGLFDLGLGLNKQGYVDHAVAVPVVGLPSIARRGAALDIDEPEQPSLAFAGSGSILTDPWVPGNEDDFANRIDGLVVDEALQLIVFPGTFTFGFLPPFFEGIKGQDAELRSQSTMVLSRDIERF